jgi:hypothetical protein
LLLIQVRFEYGGEAWRIKTSKVTDEGVRKRNVQPASAVARPQTINEAVGAEPAGDLRLIRVAELSR